MYNHVIISIICFFLEIGGTVGEYLNSLRATPKNLLAVGKLTLSNEAVRIYKNDFFCVIFNYFITCTVDESIHINVVDFRTSFSYSRARSHTNCLFYLYVV